SSRVPPPPVDRSTGDATRTLTRNQTTGWGSVRGADGGRWSDRPPLRLCSTAEESRLVSDLAALNRSRKWPRSVSSFSPTDRQDSDFCAATVLRSEDVP